MCLAWGEHKVTWLWKCHKVNIYIHVYVMVQEECYGPLRRTRRSSQPLMKVRATHPRGAWLSRMAEIGPSCPSWRSVAFLYSAIFVHALFMFNFVQKKHCFCSEVFENRVGWNWQITLHLVLGTSHDNNCNQVISQNQNTPTCTNQAANCDDMINAVDASIAYISLTFFKENSSYMKGSAFQSGHNAIQAILN